MNEVYLLAFGILALRILVATYDGIRYRIAIYNLNKIRNQNVLHMRRNIFGVWVMKRWYNSRILQLASVGLIFAVAYRYF